MRNESWPQGDSISTCSAAAPRSPELVGDVHGVLRAEAPVRAEGHDERPRRDRRARRVRERLEVVHDPREVEVGQRLEAREEDLRLVVEVVLDLEVRAHRHRPALPAGAVELAAHPLLGEVGDVRHAAGDREAVRRALGELRVAEDRGARDGGEADVLRRQPRARADDDGPFDLLGRVERPLQRLHPAERAADRRVQPLDAEAAQERAVDRVEVADGEEGEVEPVRLARSRGSPTTAPSCPGSRRGGSRRPRGTGRCPPACRGR